MTTTLSLCVLPRLEIGIGRIKNVGRKNNLNLLSDDFNQHRLKNYQALVQC